MNLAIFGATGRTGQHLLRMALDQGHRVSVLVRDPAKIGIQSERLRVIQGKLDDPDCISQTVAGAQVVLSVLGPVHNKPAFDVSRGTQAILHAMEAEGVRRLIISTGAGVGDPGDAPRLFNHLMNALVKIAAGNVYADMVRTVDLVRASNLDWTVVRVPRLTDSPATGQVKAGMVGKGTGPSITRADLAAFMLEQAGDQRYIRQAPAISN